MLNEDGTVEELRRIAPDISPSVARLPMPAYILDRNGVVRWLNMAAIKEFGDMRGKRITQIVEPEYAAKARQEFAAKLLGTQVLYGGNGRGSHGGGPARPGGHQLDAAAPAGIDRRRLRAGRSDGRAAPAEDDEAPCS